jgi:hypothetical protein
MSSPSAGAVAAAAGTAAVAACAIAMCHKRRQQQQQQQQQPLLAVSSSHATTVLFLDCDDCLYQNDWVVANRITESIDRYCSQKMGLPEGKPYQLCVCPVPSTTSRGFVDSDRPPAICAPA